MLTLMWQIRKMLEAAGCNPADLTCDQPISGFPWSTFPAETAPSTATPDDSAEKSQPQEGNADKSHAAMVQKMCRELQGSLGLAC